MKDINEYGINYARFIKEQDINNKDNWNPVRIVELKNGDMVFYNDDTPKHIKETYPKDFLLSQFISLKSEDIKNTYLNLPKLTKVNAEGNEEIISNKSEIFAILTANYSLSSKIEKELGKDLDKAGILLEEIRKKYRDNNSFWSSSITVNKNLKEDILKENPPDFSHEKSYNEDKTSVYERMVSLRYLSKDSSNKDNKIK